MTFVIVFLEVKSMNASIPKNIKRLRQQNGLTQEQMAEKLFVTRQTVSLWENGKTQPDIQTLERIAEVFQVDLMTVLYGTSGTQPENRYRQSLIRWVVFTAASCGLLYLIQCLASEHLARWDGSWLMWLGLANYHVLFPVTLLGCGGWLAYLMDHNTGTPCTALKKILAVACLILCLVCALSWWIPFLTQNDWLRQLHIDLYYGQVSCKWLQPAFGYGIVWSILALRKS